MVASCGPDRDLKTAPSFVRSQASGLQRLGCHVSFGLIDDRTSMNGIRRNIQRLREQIQEERPAVVHVQYGSMLAAMARMAKGNKRFVVSFCGDDLLGTPNPGVAWRLRERISRWLGLWAAARADAIIVKSEILSANLPGSLRAKSVVIPNGVDVDSFQPVERESARKELGWDAGEFKVLYNLSSGSNSAVKNPVLAHAAVERLAQRLPSAKLEVVGSVPFERMPVLMSAADALLVTSLHEGSPNVVKEAMACDLPVVTVPCGDVRVRLQGVRPGAVCDYDADQLAEALHAVFQARGRSNGREVLIGQGLTNLGVAQQILRLYGGNPTTPVSSP